MRVIYYAKKTPKIAKILAVGDTKTTNSNTSSPVEEVNLRTWKL